MPQIEELSDREALINGYKEEGNQFIKSGDHLNAVKLYLKALDLVNESDGKKEMNAKKCENDRLILYKNLSLAYLKLKDFNNAIVYATKALELSPSDVKALFRRCQAFEANNCLNEAFKDALTLQHIEPNNTAIQPILRELNIKLQELAKQNSSTSKRLTQMLEYLSQQSLDYDKRLQSANNILVLVREKAAKSLLIELKGLQTLLTVLKSKCEKDIKLSSIRILTELANDSIEMSLDIIKTIEIKFLIQLLSESFDEEFLTAVQITIQTIIESLTGFNAKEDKKPNKELMKSYEKEIDSIMSLLVKSSTLRMMTGLGRDTILEIIITNVDYSALDWGHKLVDMDGLWSLLEIASELEEVKYESGMNITSNTRTHVALLLDRVYLCMDHDKAREKFREKVMDFINSKLKGADIEDKVRATAAITALLQGPLDVGNHCLAQPGVIEMMLVMAGSEDAVQQCVAAEAIIAAASKKDKCTSLANMGAGILKNLYKSANNRIKIRALVGLCKLGSVGGTDASIRTFSDGSTSKLSMACREFLMDPSSDKDLRKWSAEGLAYLTLDAEIKEELISDRPAMKALIDLARSGDLSVLFGVVTTFVNLTNSYEKQEVLPELAELAKFSKQHVPEDHPKDAKEFVDKRCKLLCEMQVVTALVALCKSQSKTSREMISRVFNALCEHQELRGVVVQQGGAKVLIKLALENNTDNGKNIASQALARIGITINPEVAFPGQRCVEVVRPLVALLHPDCTGLQNFEALMALTNLAQVSNSVRSRMIKDGGFSRIENYMYEDHDMIKRAATQCMLNLILSEEVVRMYEGENDRLKYLVVLSEDDDLETAKAASGALAMITSVSKKCCEKVFEAKHWHECLIQLVSSKDSDLQHRGVCIAYNLIDAGNEIAEKIVETNILEILMAITRPEVDDIDDKIKEIAKKALERAEEQNLIKHVQEL